MCVWMCVWFCYATGGLSSQSSPRSVVPSIWSQWEVYCMQWGALPWCPVKPARISSQQKWRTSGGERLLHMMTMMRWEELGKKGTIFPFLFDGAVKRFSGCDFSAVHWFPIEEIKRMPYDTNKFEKNTSPLPHKRFTFYCTYTSCAERQSWEFVQKLTFSQICSFLPLGRNS